MENARLSSRSINRIYVVYDKKNGKIIHIHEIEPSDKNLQQPTDLEMENRSIELASNINKISRDELAALLVDKEALQGFFRYEVDLDRKILIAKEDVNPSKRNGRK